MVGFGLRYRGNDIVKGLKMEKSKRDFVVYVAGPYRGSTRLEIMDNIRESIIVGAGLRAEGYTVIITHLESFFNEDCLSENDWLEHGLSLLSRCDAVYDFRKNRFSAGTELEVNKAKELSIPVCETLEGIDSAYTKGCYNEL